jgi:hypothetical protein
MFWLALAGAASSYLANRKAGKQAEKAGAFQEAAANRSAEELAAQSAESQALLNPYAQFGQQGLTQMQGMLTPEGEAAYLSQNNPMFKAALQNMNDQTATAAAISGRSLAGDTMNSYLGNWQAAALPLLQNRQNMLMNAVNTGQDAVSNQANIGMQGGQLTQDYRTSGGAARSAGMVGRSNANLQATAGLLKGLSSVGAQAGNAGGFMKLFEQFKQPKDEAETPKPKKTDMGG